MHTPIIYLRDLREPRDLRERERRERLPALTGSATFERRRAPPLRERRDLAMVDVRKTSGYIICKTKKYENKLINSPKAK